VIRESGTKTRYMLIYNIYYIYLVSHSENPSMLGVRVLVTVFVTYCALCPVYLRNSLSSISHLAEREVKF
jgi:hypothetical protein